jgi:hypothetical protein
MTSDLTLDIRFYHLAPGLVSSHSCLVVFFSALAGIGYVDPDSLPSSSISNALAPVEAAEFVPGLPVFDMSEEQARRLKIEEQRDLEIQWAKKKRPKDVS